jgi:hypothetical protein
VVLYPLITAPMIWRTFVATEMPFGSYLRSVMPALRASLVMVVAVLGVRAVTPTTWPLALQFGMSLLAGAVSYSAMVFIFERRRLRELWRLLRSGES